VWTMEAPAKKVAEQLWKEGSQRLPAEVMKLNDATAAIIVDVDGIDYVLTMTKVPKQRPRPTSN
jgi:hypothetical protein